MKSYDYFDALIEVLEKTDDYLTEEEKYIAIQTLKLVIDKFNLRQYVEEYQINKNDYEKYFKDGVKKYHNGVHKMMKKSFIQKKEIDDEITKFIRNGR